ncbi:hypothetical protein [Parabacteroides sp. PF5-6]|uniref:hypothetical protein n=1 Tax=Parabacteroides sp. PF5-6 TaxID=1742403 RepID=UPI00240706CC|nr:hypothetical protein [Parabacteroides sp. PF5-6]MDF9829035.1 hypothetical protein [Parabacteroides sp. PF5-6]
MDRKELEAQKAILAREILNTENEELEMDAEELERIIDNLPFERIPGLPYTHEERMASLRRAEEQHRLGLSITMEELEEEMKSW